MHAPKDEHMLLLKELCATFKAPLILVYIFTNLHSLVFCLTHMATGVDSHILDYPPLDIVYFLETTSSHGPLKHQPTLSRSSTEAEYRGVSNMVSESCWIQNLLFELCSQESGPIE